MFQLNQISTGRERARKTDNTIGNETDERERETDRDTIQLRDARSKERGKEKRKYS